MRLIEGIIIGVDGPLEGPSIERTYTVQWILPSGGEYIQTSVGTRQIRDDETTHRRAFAIGFTVFGAMREGTDVPILIIDREDFAVGCDTPASGGAA